MEVPYLTTRQKVVYDYLKTYFQENKRSPYIREIQEACQFSSHKAVIDKLLALERKGFIKRKLNKHRGIILNGRL
jgi:SOS-response transcriptional repressor LexA